MFEEEEESLRLLDEGAMPEFFKSIYSSDEPQILVDSAFKRLLRDDSSDINESLAYELLRHGANVDCIIDNEKGQTLLQYSAIKGKSSLIQLLLNNNASVTVIDSNGNSVLHLVAASGDLLSLSLLLMKVFEVNPKLFDLSNNQKKKYNELFKSSDQALLLTRFNELKKIKFSRRSLDSFKSLQSNKSNGLWALMVINDFQLVKGVRNLKRFENDPNLPLCLSDKMMGLITQKGSKSLKSKSKNLIRSDDGISRACDYLIKYVKIDPKINIKRNLLMKRKGINYFDDLIGPIGLIKHENPFNLFNYACSLLKKESIYKMFESLTPVNNNSMITPTESLKKFHPDLVDQFLVYLKNLEICPICKEAEQYSTKTWTKFHCNHKFHLNCIQEWFNHSYERRCPICRRGI